MRQRRDVRVDPHIAVPEAAQAPDAAAPAPARMRPRVPRPQGYGTPPASAELKGARLSRGLTLKEVEQLTGIRAQYLQAIESGVADQMPGRAFDFSYIRAYVTFLEMERFQDHSTDWYVARIREELFGDGRAAMRGPLPGALVHGARELARPGAAVLIALAVLGGLAAAGVWGFHAVQKIEIVEPAGPDPAARG